MLLGVLLVWLSAVYATSITLPISATCDIEIDQLVPAITIIRRTTDAVPSKTMKIEFTRLHEIDKDNSPVGGHDVLLNTAFGSTDAPLNPSIVIDEHGSEYTVAAATLKTASTPNPVLPDLKIEFTYIINNNASYTVANYSTYNMPVHRIHTVAGVFKIKNWFSALTSTARRFNKLVLTSTVTFSEDMRTRVYERPSFSIEEETKDIENLLLGGKSVEDVLGENISPVATETVLPRFFMFQLASRIDDATDDFVYECTQLATRDKKLASISPSAITPKATTYTESPSKLVFTVETSFPYFETELGFVTFFGCKDDIVSLLPDITVLISSGTFGFIILFICTFGCRWNSQQMNLYNAQKIKIYGNKIVDQR